MNTRCGLRGAKGNDADCRRRIQAARGFTLTELAIVLVIVALLLGGLLVPLSAQYDIANVSATRKTENEIVDALIGFAVANGRLPCPAAPNTTGVEAAGIGGAGNGPCGTSVQVNAVADGLVPGETLGLSPLNSQHYVVDAWGNPIRYAVSIVSSNTFTNLPAAGMHNYWLNNPAPPNGDLHICMDRASITNPGTATADCPSPHFLVGNAIAVVYSTGKHAPGCTNPTDDECANLDGDKIFVSHTPNPPGGPGGEFDDIVTWLSSTTLYNRLVAARVLP